MIRGLKDGEAFLSPLSAGETSAAAVVVVVAVGPWWERNRAPEAS